MLQASNAVAFCILDIRKILLLPNVQKIHTRVNVVKQ